MVLFFVQLNPNKNYSNEKNIIKFNITNLSKKTIILNEQIRVLCHYNNFWSRNTFNDYFYQNNLPCYNEIQLNININYNYNYIQINTNNININNNNEMNNEINSFSTLTFSFNFSKIETQDKYILFSYFYPYK